MFKFRIVDTNSVMEIGSVTILTAVIVMSIDSVITRQDLYIVIALLIDPVQSRINVV